VAPENDSLTHFVDCCRDFQPIREEDIDRYFKGIIAFPLDPEPLMHAYLWFNRYELFPQVKELILYEKPIGKDRLPNESKVDFVFLTKDDTLLLAEVKFLPEGNVTEDGRKRISKRITAERNRKRNKLIDQMRRHMGYLIGPDENQWSISKDMIELAVLSNDARIGERARGFGWDHRKISHDELMGWRNEIYRERIGSSQNEHDILR
jgi:hypothetical protein